MNDNLDFGRNTYYLCVTLGFLCTRFVWGRIVSVIEGVLGEKSVLLLNALPCAYKNMVLGGGRLLFCVILVFLRTRFVWGWYRFCEYRCFR